jgi:tetratricopeptide (TPR) repeat protein
MGAGEHVSRGYELKRRGKLDEALVEYDKAVELGGRTTGPLMARGELYFEMKKYEQAIEDYTRAIALDRSLADAYAQRSVCYARIGEDQKSDADAVRSRKLADETLRRSEELTDGRDG